MFQEQFASVKVLSLLLSDSLQVVKDTKCCQWPALNGHLIFYANTNRCRCENKAYLNAPFFNHSIYFFN